MRILLSTVLTFALAAGCASPGTYEQKPAAPSADISADTATVLHVAARSDGSISSLVGGQLGVGGGFVIGARSGMITRDDAIQASHRAEKTPAKPEDVDRAHTADLNDDGFVTLDEIVAMFKANLSDQELIQRLQSTGQHFELTEFQDDYLRTRGISDKVIREMLNLKQDLLRTAERPV